MRNTLRHISYALLWMLMTAAACVVLGGSEVKADYIMSNYYTVTGSGYTYDGTNNVLTITSDGVEIKKAKISMNNTGHIKIDPGNRSENITLTISEMNIRGRIAGEPGIEIADDYTGTVTLFFKGVNWIFTDWASAIQKKGDKSTLILQGDKNSVDGYNLYVDVSAGENDFKNTRPAAIGGCDSEKDSGNIIIESGTYSLTSKAGGAVIGGASPGGKGSDITISGGVVEATSNTVDGDTEAVAKIRGAAIGGGGNANGENIKITGGVVTAEVHGKSEYQAGAAIGGGCNGEAVGLEISGGEVTATASDEFCGCAIGSGSKTSSSWTAGTSVNISGGIIKADSSHNLYGAGIGGCGFSSSHIDTATINISGGTIEATGGNYSPGIGGGNYSSAKVYISGGSVKATAGTTQYKSDGTTYTADSIGLSAYSKSTSTCTSELKNKEGGVDVELKTAENYTTQKNSLADVEIWKDNSDISASYNYGITDMKTDDSNKVYVYLPTDHTLKKVFPAGDRKTTINTDGLTWNYTAPMYYTGSNKIELQNIPSNVKVTYSNNSISNVSSIGKELTATATLSPTASTGYEVSTGRYEQKWQVDWYPSDSINVLYNNGSKQSSYNGAVAISATGYTVSDSPNGTYSASYSLNNSDAKTLYFKQDTTGYIAKIDNIQVNIDTTIHIDLSAISWNYNADTCIYNGKQYTVELNLSDEQKQGVDIVYSGNAETEVGSYTAKATIKPKPNYTIDNLDNNALTLSWRIKKYTASPTLSYNGGEASEWYKGTTVSITAGDYKISTSSNGTFTSPLTLTGGGEKTLYFQSTDGYITTDGVKINLKFDDDNPTGSISVDGKKYSDNRSSGSIKCHMSDAKVAIIGADATSGIASVKYAITTSRVTDNNIESLEWKNYTEGGVAFPSNSESIIYARIEDKVGHITYISTDAIYNDTAAPSVQNLTIDNITDSSIRYSFSLSETGTYYGVLLSKDDTPPSTYEAVKSLYDNTSDNTVKGRIYNTGTGENNKTISGLEANTGYVLYVAASDNRKNMNDADNANYSAVVKQSVTTAFKTVSIANQTFAVKTGPAQSYTYDIKEHMLKAAIDDISDLGTISYSVTKESGSILSADPTVDGNGIMTIPVNALSSVGSQNITINFTFGNNAYEPASAKLTINAVDRTPVVPTGISVNNKEYGDNGSVISGTLQWEDSSTNTVVGDITDVTYTYKNVKTGNETTAEPTDAGEYDLTIAVNGSDTRYTGSKVYRFTISPKDLNSEMSNVKWYISHGSNKTEYSESDVYYEDGDAYTLTVEGYPEDVVVPSYSGNSNSQANADGDVYTATVTYNIKSELNANNYILPESSSRTWSIKKKQEVITKTTPDITGYSWVYIDSNGHVYNSDEYCVYDGSTSYRAELTGVKPAGIGTITYSDQGYTTAGEYTTTATFTVSDERYYNVPAIASTTWTIHEPGGSEEPDNPDPVPDPKAKKNVDMSGVKWVYEYNGTTNGYENGTELYEDTGTYTLSVTDLPEQVEVSEYTGTREADSAGDYTVTAVFKVKEEYAENYEVPEPITMNWNILLYTTRPHDDPPTTEQVDVPEVGSVTASSGSKFKVLTSSESGGTVEYQGLEKANKKVKKVSVPSTVTIEGQTYKVTSIKDNAFSGYSKLTKVTIGGNVEKIGKKAFAKCTSLKSVIIPGKVTTIGDNAFNGCKKLNKITIKSKVLKKVGKNSIKGINKKATIKCPNKKLVKQYKKLFKSKTGYKKTMKIK